MKLTNINFNDSCFDKNYCFEFKDCVYEILSNDFKHIDGSDPLTKFRVVLSEDDYDYVEDLDLARKLEIHINN